MYLSGIHAHMQQSWPYELDLSMHKGVLQFSTYFINNLLTLCILIYCIPLQTLYPYSLGCVGLSLGDKHYMREPHRWAIYGHVTRCCFSPLRECHTPAAPGSVGDRWKPVAGCCALYCLYCNCAQSNVNLLDENYFVDMKRMV